jgi:haloalkane dehalogenase
MAAITRAIPAWVDREAWPWPVRHVDVGPGAMAHVDVGEGETILFVHGTPTWGLDWRHLIRALSTSHRCVAPDLLGFGLSDRPADFAYTPEAHAAALERFVDALGLRGVTLVVHDFGGPIGLPLALRRPDVVARVVVVNTWMWSFEDDPKMAPGARLIGGRLGRFLYRWANLSLRVIAPSAWGDRRKLTPALQRQLLAPFPGRWERGVVLWTLARSLLGSSACYAALWAERAALARLPVLIVWGLKDTAFRPYLLDRWREAVPHADVVALDVGHWPHEEDPDAFVAALRTFLARAA